MISAQCLLRRFPIGYSSREKVAKGLSYCRPKCKAVIHNLKLCVSFNNPYSTTAFMQLKPTVVRLSGHMYEESIPAAEKEQEITMAEFLAETGSDRTYNTMLQKLTTANARLQHQIDNGAGEEDIIESMQNVASVQWDLGTLNEAQSLQESILSKLMALHSNNAVSGNEPPKHMDIAITMHTIGSIQSRLVNPREAEKWFNAAFHMKKELLSNYSFHYEIGKTLNGLALVKMQLDHEEEIESDPMQFVQLLGEAVDHYVYHGERKDETEVEEEVDDMADHPHVASINENMAMIYRKYGDLNMALQKYENALRIHKHWISDFDMNLNGNENIMNLNMHCGDCFQGLEKFDKALERYEEALRQHHLVVRREAAQVEDIPVQESRKLEAITPIAGILIHNMGLMHSQQGRHTEAMIEFQAALDIKKSFGEHHPEVANTLNAIGAMKASQGQADSALAHFKEALEIFRMNSNVTDENQDEDIHQTQMNIKLVEENLAGKGSARLGGGRMRGTTF